MDSGRQVPIQNVVVFLPGPSVEYFSLLWRGFSKQHIAPSLGNKLHMVFTAPSRMGVEALR